MKNILALFYIMAGALALTPLKIVDHEDPYYTDICLKTTGELCEFCCLTDQVTCSQDAQTCEPVLDRGLQQLWEAGYILGGIMFGFPLAVLIFQECMITRYLPKCFPATGGVTVFECMARAGYCLLCCRNFRQTYQQLSEDDLRLAAKLK